ncbi:MAG: glycosyltransferase, partial [Candidatus Latescibacteria bacterium]|nr:glycosyltransferase [Candidatus Latescibacterota bacterium]
PFNTAGVPIAFVKAERALGIDSRLVTFGRNRYGFEEDLCLDLPWLDGRLFCAARDRLSSASQRALTGVKREPGEKAKCPLVWAPGNRLEAALITIRERLWRRRIHAALESLDFFNHDLYQLDGGLDFFRTGEHVQALHARGKKIVCCYLGSDLRTRGVIPAVDAVSHLNFTVEFDHLRLHPRITYLFFPFDPGRYRVRDGENPRLRVFHSATNRRYKGSDWIIAVGKRLEHEHGIEFVFVERKPHAEVIALKQTSDIVIDQITNAGGVGYGMSSLEALSMGIPVCTNLPPDHEAFIPDHPFVNVNAETLYGRLVDLIRSPRLRHAHGQHGRQWVEQYHDARNVVRRMQAMYQERGWLR